MAKKSYSNYKKMSGHPGYFQNPNSLRIKYIKVHSGVRVTVFTKKTKITDAKKVVDDYLVSIFSANPKKEMLEKKGIKNPSLETIWKQIIEEREASRHEHTLEGYDVSWRIGIAPFWGKKTVLDLNSRTMSDYERWYLKKMGNRVFFNTGKHLSMLIRYCHLNGYINKPIAVPNIDLTIARNTKKEDVGRVYTDRELNACLDKAFSPLVRVAIICYRYMGLRKNELLTAQRKHWNLKEGIAKVWSAKNKKWRTIVIPPVAVKALTEWLSQCEPSEWLFPASTNPKKFIASQVYDEQWRKTKVAAGISGAEVENAARTHDWRHTFATQTARDGWPPIAACHVLDMSLQEYQETYTHVSIDDIMSLMLKSFGGLK